MMLLSLFGKYDTYGQWDWRGVSISLGMANHVVIQWRYAFAQVLLKYIPKGNTYDEIVKLFSF